jgi:hypothetical protein
MDAEDILEILLVIQEVIDSDPNIVPKVTRKRFNAFLNLAKASLQILPSG